MSDTAVPTENKAVSSAPSVGMLPETHRYTHGHAFDTSRRQGATGEPEDSGIELRSFVPTSPCFDSIGHAVYQGRVAAPFSYGNPISMDEAPFASTTGLQSMFSSPSSCNSTEPPVTRGNSSSSKAPVPTTEPVRHGKRAHRVLENDEPAYIVDMLQIVIEAQRKRDKGDNGVAPSRLMAQMKGAAVAKLVGRIPDVKQLTPEELSTCKDTLLAGLCAYIDGVGESDPVYDLRGILNGNKSV